jgi:hypothetical protein
MTEDSATPQMDIGRQRFKLRVWITSRLWAQVMAGMVLGFGLGLLMGEGAGLVAPGTADSIGMWLALPGRIFLALIAMVLVPLIFSSIVGGLNGAGSGAELRAVGLRLAAFIVLTSTAAEFIVRPALFWAIGRPAGRRVLDSWSVRVASFRTTDIARIRRLESLDEWEAA